jgi:cytochrome c-type biogenesis protein CcmH
MNPFWSVSLFWIAAVLFVAVALAFVLPPLLRKKAPANKPGRRDVNIAVYRDQLKEMEAERANGLLAEDQFQSAKLELEARLAEDALVAEAGTPALAAGSRKLGFSLAAALPAVAFGLYFWLGNPMSLIAIAEARSQTQAQPNAATGEHDIARMVQKVEEKVKANPQDGKSWGMLGKTYAALERWPEAAKAYAQAARLMPKEASVLSGQAEALAIVNNRVLKGQPMDLVYKAMELDPNDAKSLELSAINAFQEKNYAQAAYYFKHLLKLLPPESPYAQDILAAEKEARRLAESSMTGLDNLADQAPAAPKQKGASIQGSVDIAPALKGKVSGKDVIFLFARTGQSGPPVAAVRAAANKLPLEFELDDSMAMNPGNTLSLHKEVILVARISRSGDPMPQPGDLEGSVAAVKVGAKNVKLVIDKARP